MKPLAGMCVFRIKICGITNVDDALATARAGADALGLNFYPCSPRCVSPEVARNIIAAVPAETVKVGLFVNSPAGEVCRSFDDLGLDLIQLHGDEPPEYLIQLGRRPVMRAFRIGTDGLRPVTEYLSRCRELGALPALTLLDSAVAGAYGGTGTTVNWKMAGQYVSAGDVPPLVLAGGLSPENVTEAICDVRPAAVDTASGVESRRDAKIRCWWKRLFALPKRHSIIMRRPVITRNQRDRRSRRYARRACQITRQNPMMSVLELLSLSPPSEGVGCVAD